MRFLVALMIAQNMRKFKFKLALYQPLSKVAKDMAIGAGGSPPLRRFLFSFGIRNCVAQAQRWALPLVTCFSGIPRV